MRFSLLLEVQIASPIRAPERQALLQTVEQGVLAEALGYDGVWAVEHHGLVEYSPPRPQRCCCRSSPPGPGRSPSATP